MRPQHLYTVADPSQFKDLFQGEFMKGHREPRIAIVGRSNVGKSTLINSILEAKLAQTSHQPGKTRALHFYLWPKAGKIVVDLPGYGYARAAKTDREKWEKFIDLYFQQDPNLMGTLVLLDSRHGPTDSDLEAIEFLLKRQVPVTVVFTKFDTLKTQSLRVRRQREAVEQLSSWKDALVEVFWVSSKQGVGVKKLIHYLSSGDQVGGET